MSGVDVNPAALFGFAPLGLEQTLRTSTDIIGQLTQIFGPVAATPVEVIIKDWRLDRDALPDPDRQLSAMDTYGGPPLSGSDGRRSDPLGVDRNRL
ncbi:MAG: hypothetical protein ABIR32_02270 [Ilumatobacteraceae bacterium]